MTTVDLDVFRQIGPEIKVWNEFSAAGASAFHHHHATEKIQKKDELK
jgi:hypothetical protein